MDNSELKNLAWAGTSTRNFEAMVQFLKVLLGLHLIKKTEDFAEFQLQGGDKFEVFNDNSPWNAHFTTGPVVEFLVDDVLKTQSLLEQAGISFFGPVQTSGGYSWTHF